MIKVTAVITTHKRPVEIVKRALESVINQTYRPLQIIVVDDSPFDYEERGKVAGMVKGYDQVEYIAHEQCKGACAARNTGLIKARGEFIAFLDDDDEWIPDKIERQLKMFTRDSVALVSCGTISVNDDTGEERINPGRKLDGYIYELLMEKNYVGSTSFPLIKTKALNELGGFDVLMPAAQDYEVWLRIAQRYEIVSNGEPLAIYHWHSGEQITKNYGKKVAGRERLIVKHKNYLDRHPSIFASWLRDMVVMYAKEKQMGRALNCWFSAVAKQPYCILCNMRYLYYVFRCVIH